MCFLLGLYLCTYFHIWIVLFILFYIWLFSSSTSFYPFPKSLKYSLKTREVGKQKDLCSVGMNGRGPISSRSQPLGGGTGVAPPSGTGWRQWRRFWFRVVLEMDLIWAVRETFQGILSVWTEPLGEEWDRFQRRGTAGAIDLGECPLLFGTAQLFGSSRRLGWWEWVDLAKSSEAADTWSLRCKMLDQKAPVDNSKTAPPTARLYSETWVHIFWRSNTDTFLSS